MKDIHIGAHINTCSLVFTNPIAKYIKMDTLLVFSFVPTQANPSTWLTKSLTWTLLQAAS